MTNSQRLAAVRERLRAWYEARTQHAETPWEIAESILIRDGFYCGRTFRFADFRAVWFLEEEQVKIYDTAGALLESFATVDDALHRSTIKMPVAELPVTQSPAAEDPIRRAA